MVIVVLLLRFYKRDNPISCQGLKAGENAELFHGYRFFSFIR